MINSNNIVDREVFSVNFGIIKRLGLACHSREAANARAVQVVRQPGKGFFLYRDVLPAPKQKLIKP
jgi:hypothetical protein